MLGDWGGGGKTKTYDIRYIVQRNCVFRRGLMHVAHQASKGIHGYVMLTLVIHDSFCHAQGRVRRHLHGAKVTRWKSQLTEL